MNIEPLKSYARPGIGRVVLTSCKLDQWSMEAPELGHGVFTYFLLEGLKGQADFTEDGVVDIDELAKYVKYHVPNYVYKNMRIYQEPFLDGRYSGSIAMSFAP